MLRGLGEILTAQGARASVVVVGGAALALLGWVPRSTTDVDVIAFARMLEGRRVLEPPEPVPAALEAAIERVARDFNLASDWMNTTVGAQWHQGLPPSLPDDIEWIPYGNLEVGLVGHTAQIELKLYASGDLGPDSVHVQDLIALRPSTRELQDARRWVVNQDAADEFPSLVDKVIEHVRQHVGSNR